MSGEPTPGWCERAYELICVHLGSIGESAALLIRQYEAAQRQHRWAEGSKATDGDYCKDCLVAKYQHDPTKPCPGTVQRPVLPEEKALPEASMNKKTPKADKIYQWALLTWGVDAQLCMAQEECGELTAAINRFRRGRSEKTDLAEEIADVMIMMQQLRLIVGPDYVDYAIEIKNERLLGRLRG